MRYQCVVDAVEPGSYIALYCSPESFEMFYLCHVKAIEAASDDIVDDYNHTIRKGTKYLKYKCLEERSEKKVNIFYKLVQKVYILPAQAVYPFVSLRDDLLVSASKYQWFTDSI